MHGYGGDSAIRELFYVVFAYVLVELVGSGASGRCV